MTTKITLIIAATVLTFGVVKHTLWPSAPQPEEVSSTIAVSEASLDPIIPASIAVEETLPEEELEDEVVYGWDQTEYAWVPIKEGDATQIASSSDRPTSVLVEPIDLTWPFLMDINYKLKFYEEVGMEMYAPIFPDGVLALEGKEVVIEGFVIPFDEEGDLLALSANPFASCFFCGKASPASVLSLHLRKKRNRYKMDDYLKFRGVLRLNYDDPKEFYYVLEDSVED